MPHRLHWLWDLSQGWEGVPAEDGELHCQWDRWHQPCWRPHEGHGHWQCPLMRRQRRQPVLGPGVAEARPRRRSPGPDRPLGRCQTTR